MTRHAAVFALTIAMLGCGSPTASTGSSSSVGARPALTPLSLPDTSSASESVQAQIRQQYAALTHAIERKDIPAGELATEYGDMGKLFVAAEYFDAAMACFANAQRLVPEDMRWPYLLGHVFRLEGDAAAAAVRFERARALQPNHVPTLSWLAEMHLAQGRPQAALPLLARASELAPRSGAVFHGLGRVALEAGDYAGAVKHLMTALELAPGATSIHYPLAMAYRGLGDRRMAEEHLRRRGTVEAAPDDPLLEEIAGLLQNAAAFETRGASAIGERNWDEAVTNLRRAIALAPDNAFTRLNLGTALYMKNDHAGALDQYREAVRLSPGLSKAHFAIGVLMEARGRDDDAMDAFRSAVASDADYVEARFSLANALRRNGQVLESLSHYADVLRVTPAVSQASFGYAIGLVRMGRHREARDRLEEAVKAFPDQPGFAHALARLLAASPDGRVRDGARAYGVMVELLKRQRTLGLSETMAMTLAELKRFDEAVRWQRDAIEVARQTGRTDLVARLADNLRLYESGQPCRTPWAEDDPIHHPRPSSD